MIRILLVDDHPSTREGAKSLIEQDQEISVTTLSSSLKALQLLEHESFDVLLFELALPLINGIELTTRVKRKWPGSLILIFTAHDFPSSFNMIIEAGAVGHIDKSATGPKICRSIRAVLEGDVIVPLSLITQLRRTNIQAREETSDLLDSYNRSITEKEQRILLELAKGITNDQLAKNMHVAKRTLEGYLTTLYKKLQVPDKKSAIKVAKRYGLMNIETIE